MWGGAVVSLEQFGFVRGALEATDSNGTQRKASTTVIDKGERPFNFLMHAFCREKTVVDSEKDKKLVRRFW